MTLSLTESVIFLHIEKRRLLLYEVSPLRCFFFYSFLFFFSFFIHFYLLFLQVAGESAIMIGNISSLPKSIESEKTIFENPV